MNPGACILDALGQSSHPKISATFPGRVVASNGLRITPATPISAKLAVSLDKTLAVSRITGIDRVMGSDWRRSHTANPSIPGIDKSSKIALGRSVFRISKHSCSDSAARVFHPARSSRHNCTSSRRCSWSSTMRICFPIILFLGRRLLSYLATCKAFILFGLIRNQLFGCQLGLKYTSLRNSSNLQWRVESELGMAELSIL